MTLQALPTYTFSQDGVTPLETGQPRPHMVERDGWLIQVPDARLAEFGWFQEYMAPLAAYEYDGYEALPVIESGRAVYYPVPVDAATRAGRALDALRGRLAQERERRVAIATTGLDPEAEPAIDDPMGYQDVRAKQLAAMMQALQLARLEARGQASAEQSALLDVMDAIPGEVHAIDQARAAIWDWAVAHLSGFEVVDGFDATQPPEEAPQWP